MREKTWPNERPEPKDGQFSLRLKNYKSAERLPRARQSPDWPSEGKASHTHHYDLNDSTGGNPLKKKLLKTLQN